jgi:hypothetical protein
MIALLTALLLLSATSVWAQASSQTPPPKSKFGTPMETPEKPPSKFGTPIARESERVQDRIILVPVIKPVRVAPKEGHLALYTVPESTVVLTPLFASGGDGRKLKQVANRDGITSFGKLKPGDYQVEIVLGDYEPLSDKVRIRAGQVTPMIGLLKAKFATVTLILGVQDAADMTVKINGAQVMSERLKSESGNIIIQHVPVGPNQVTCSKPGFDDFTAQLAVKPGDNNFPGTLKRATIALTIRTKPGAAIYLNDERKDDNTDGILRIPGLAPGAYRLRVRLDGHENVERQLNLTLDRREEVIEAPLIPIAEDEEIDAAADPSIVNWIPALPSGWKFETGNPRGLRVTGESVALVNNTSKLNRRFNIYRDFTLVLNLIMTDGKGAAWVVRAQDDRNYYLFELTTSKSQRGEKYLSFYVCREGRCELRDGYPVVADIEKPGEPLTITLEATGDRFRHFIETGALRKTPLVKDFRDGTFSLGGVGLRSINGLKMFVNQYLVIPQKQ